ncbi:MAG: hypothetical protein ACRDTR_24720 [Rubrobacter sp.]
MGRRLAGRDSAIPLLFVAVFVGMIGYSIVVPLLPFYAREYATSALLVGMLGYLCAKMQFAGGRFLGSSQTATDVARSS